eukprot:TRINITY_DN6988_c0_g1_i1.p1 TRINITY_DN6988_c0_g1~~TRINITY_DN6988_c0_g1_i1.p1  ORF type:complete len:210 (-),score=24.00 TRINITY_DN6988_c0_g1_i1:78-707(-)
MSNPFKVMLVGDPDSGKTALLHRFTDDVYKEIKETSEACFKIKLLSIGEESVKMQLWDVDSINQKLMTSSYFQQAQAVVVVFNVYNQANVDNLSDWFEQVDQWRCRPQTIKILVGHKYQSDGKERVISFEDGKKIANDAGFSVYTEASAKHGENIRETFVNMVNTQRKSNRISNNCETQNDTQEGEEEEEEEGVFSESSSKNSCVCSIQ